jgi:preprotein translocase subunit SecA
LPTRIFGTNDRKWQAIADEIFELHQQGRPVLIGTRSIDKSEHLSQLLSQRGIPTRC